MHLIINFAPENNSFIKFESNEEKCNNDFVSSGICNDDQLRIQKGFGSMSGIE